MKWSAAYATGFENIDSQHRMLFAMSDNFREALLHGEGERTYGDMLEALTAYARAHFGIEEMCMHDCQCPAADTNLRAHAGFIEMLNTFQQQYRVNGFSRADAFGLVDFVDGWLVNHIGKIDIRLRPCAQRA